MPACWPTISREGKVMSRRRHAAGSSNPRDGTPSSTPATGSPALTVWHLRFLCRKHFLEMVVRLRDAGAEVIDHDLPPRSKKPTPCTGHHVREGRAVS